MVQHHRRLLSVNRMLDAAQNQHAYKDRAGVGGDLFQLLLGYGGTNFDWAAKKLTTITTCRADSRTGRAGDKILHRPRHGTVFARVGQRPCARRLLCPGRNAPTTALV